MFKSVAHLVDWDTEQHQSASHAVIFEAQNIEALKMNLSKGNGI